MIKEKLVRDKIPELIEKDGKKPITRIAPKREYEERLAEKLLEEAAEFHENRSREELADVLEVVRAICSACGFRLEEIEKLREKKMKEKGGFKDRIILEGIRGRS